MPSIKRFGIWSNNEILTNELKKSEIYIQTDLNESLLSETFFIEILAIDLNHFYFKNNKLSPKFIQILIAAHKIIFIFTKNQTLPVEILSYRRPDLLICLNEFSIQNFLEMDNELKKLEQEKSFLKISEDLNTNYEAIKLDFEKKLTEDQKKLLDSRRKILETNNRHKALRKILFAIYQETEAGQIETLLNEFIPKSTEATWVKIINKNQKLIFENDIKSELNLDYQYFDLHSYLIYFIKGDTKKFKKVDTEFFQKISSALLLNLNRNKNLSDLIFAENILSNAFLTFNLPLAVIKSNYHVVQSNKIFHQFNGEKCYAQLFGRTEPCIGCQRYDQDQNQLQFQIKINNKVFDVSSNFFSIDSDKQKNWVHIYKDRTEEFEIEQRLTQNAKLNDLGLISSSIAHELNNPLGGIISYLQILQMDIDQNSDLQNDISVMYEGALKIKKIIEDLLIFSRKPETFEKKLVNFTSFITECFMDFDQLLKTENIKFVNQLKNTNTFVELNKSEFKNSIYHIFQFFIERTRSYRKLNKNFIGLVEFKADYVFSKIILKIIGNFGPLDNNFKLKNIQFLAIHKTLLDQGLDVDFTELDQTWVTVNLSIPIKN